MFLYGRYFGGEPFPGLYSHTVEPPLTATSQQRPLFLVLVDSPYIDSSLNLFTKATSLQQHWPLKRVLNCQNLLTAASFDSN